jgi:DNA-binding SARP family transcriptional activator
LANSDVLTMKLLGPIEMRLGDRALAGGAPAVQALAASLVLSPGQAEDRGRLAALLWPEADETRARQSLRQTLHQLRAQLGEAWPGLTADRVTVALRPGLVQSDLQDITAALAEGEVPRAVIDEQFLPDRLLASLADRGTLWSDWLRLRRREIERTWRDLLEGMWDRPHLAERADRALLALDPSDETAARRLIALYARQGDLPRALKVYSELWDYLGSEFDSEPSGLTQELIAQIKAGREEPATVLVGAVGPTATGLRIGVEAPGNASGPQTPESRVFRRELIACLSRFREIEVVDLALGRHPSDYLLSLEIVPQGARTMATAVLTRRADGQVTWSARREIATAHWWESQAGLVDQVAAGCNLKLSRMRLAEISRTGLLPSAVDAWLAGEAELYRFRPDAWRRAETHFRTSIRLDPEYSRAFSSLAQLKNAEHLVLVGLHRKMETHREARALAGRAIALDPWDARAYLHRGWANCLAGQFDQASASFQMARDLNPADPWTLISSALGAAFGGELELAKGLSEEMLRRHWTTAPQHWAYHATIRFVAGDLQGCVDAATEAGETLINVAGWEAAAQWRLGRREEAAAAWHRLMQLSRAQWSVAEPHCADAVQSWFLSCFPISNRDRAEELSRGLRAARAYAH